MFRSITIGFPSTSHVRKQVQNGHAKDIILIHISITELFCLCPLHNTGEYDDKFIIAKQARCIGGVNVPFHHMGCSKPCGWDEP
jgi:hypothetical protein